MNFDEAQGVLTAFAKLSVKEQQAHKDEILEVFDIFWASNPSRAKFGAACSGLVLCTEMLWIMVKQT